MKHPASLRFDHLAVAVDDARSAYELFADVLQLPLVAAYEGDDWDGASWLMMIFGLADDGQIALCARRGADQHRHSATDLPHCALTVSAPAQLGVWAARLQAAGFAIRREDHGDQQSIYFDDRCGLTWELTTPRAETSTDADARSVIEHWISATASPW
jgi:catechol 2,3-dioxygenase-like lactoylglutathione lyase family enzyme